MKTPAELSRVRDVDFIGRIQKVLYGTSLKGGTNKPQHSEVVFNAEMSKRVAVSLRRIAQKLLS